MVSMSFPIKIVSFKNSIKIVSFEMYWNSNMYVENDDLFSFSNTLIVRKNRRKIICVQIMVLMSFPIKIMSFKNHIRLMM